MSNAYKTAISRKKASRPTLDNIKCGRLYGNILDYGCGKGKDVEVLLEKGFNVVGYDPYYNDILLPERYFDVIYCNFVLNVVESKEARVKIIERLFELLKNGGTIIIATRNTRDIEASKTVKWTVKGDGYVNSKGSFQTGIDTQELIELFADCRYNYQATVKPLELTKYASIELTCKLI